MFAYGGPNDTRRISPVAAIHSIIEHLLPKSRPEEIDEDYQQTSDVTGTVRFTPQQRNQMSSATTKCPIRSPILTFLSTLSSQKVKGTASCCSRGLYRSLPTGCGKLNSLCLLSRPALDAVARDHLEEP